MSLSDVAKKEKSFFVGFLALHMSSRPTREVSFVSVFAEVSHAWPNAISGKRRRRRMWGRTLYKKFLKIVSYIFFFFDFVSFLESRFVLVSPVADVELFSVLCEYAEDDVDDAWGLSLIHI